MFRSLGRRALAIALVSAVAMGVGTPALADDGVRIAVTQLDGSDFPNIRLVAALSDAQGRGVRGLAGAKLVVVENGVAQDATLVPASEAAPIAIALVLDTSGSMAGRPLADAKRAMTSLIESLGSADQAAIVTFSGSARIAQALTPNKQDLAKATAAAVAAGDTAIYDALATATASLASAPPHARRAIVLLTDGVDTASRADHAAVLAALGAAQLTPYVVGLGTDLDRPSLSGIASASPGGRFVEAPTSGDLAGIYAGLADQLLTQYSVTFRSNSSAADDTLMSIGLTLTKDGATLASAAAIYRVPAGRGVPAPTQRPVTQPAQTVEPAGVAAPAIVFPRSLAPELIGLLGAATVLTLLLWVAELASRYPGRQRERLEVFVRGLAVTAPEHAKRRSIIQRVIVPSLQTAGRPLFRIAPAVVVARTGDRLRQAGEPMGLGAVEFLGVRVGLALLAATVGMAIAALVTQDAASVPYGAVAGACFGYAIPGFVVDALARGRRAEIRRALPAALDMLALSAEAGLSFDGAIGQVAHRWDTALSDEFRGLLLEFQMGRERRDALRDLAHRTGVIELSRFASAVVQADSLGVPLSRVLHEQSSEIRLRRRQRAEELARKAPVKMLFPMVALIFPALFVVVLGPAVPRLLSAFGSFH